MPLTLTIRNAPRLDNGSPLSLVLDRRGAIIGRAATADWCLPDPSLHISSRHCEIRFADGRYELVDTSTNGTFLFGQGARLAAPHGISQNDVFVIGPFEIAAALDDAAATAAAQRNAAPAAPEWKGWSAFGGDAAAAPAANMSSWDAKPSGSAISGTGPMSQNWAPPAASSGVPAPAAPPPASSWGAPPAGVAPAPVASSWGATAPPSPPSSPSTWDSAPPPPATPASAWSSPTAPPPPPSPDDVWGKFAASNVVDWARGGFGSPAPAPLAPTPAAPASFGLAPAAPAATADSFGLAPPPRPETTAPPMAQHPLAAPPSAASPAPAPAGGLPTLLAAAGVDPARLKQSEGDVLAQAGDLLRRLVAGLVVMLEARARAKSQMGAQGTNLEFEGNNPLKFARSPEQALAQLLNPTERGFMSPDRAIEDAYKDLQAHQMATLKAMQGALRATLDRFSPTAIRARAEHGGLLAKIMPGARDAALWKAYEREFGGVAHGSDEAFMDVFAKEFRRAYEEMSAKR
ncbi:MAG: type VI secretion system-associated FHA domain protein TagH [Novosphingobium sp.]|nr:type VI secretion system-associated FHA domain protein TagH [Novosphingobium sp.]